MNIKQTISVWLVAVFAMIGIVSLSPATTYAANPERCAGVEVSILVCDKKYDNSKDGGIEKNGVWALLLLAVNILVAGVGVVAVGGIVYGSILYASAGGNTEQVKKGIKVIRDVVIGLIAFVGMYAFLQFLIPGGIFT